ncbi:MAG: hypothetical protein RR303_00185 [Bacteroidales bacterium]
MVTLLSEIERDEEDLISKAHALLLACNKDVEQADSILIALCGFSLKSLLSISEQQ